MKIRLKNLKNVAALLTLLMLITVTVSGSNTFQLTQVNYPIYANGELVPQGDLPVLSYQDRTYVPLRMVSESSGLDVNFDEQKEAIYLENAKLKNEKYYFSMYNAYDMMFDAVDDAFEGGDMVYKATCAKDAQTAVDALSIVDQNVKLIEKKIETIEVIQDNYADFPRKDSNYDGLKDGKLILQDFINDITKLEEAGKGYLLGESSYDNYVNSQKAFDKNANDNYWTFKNKCSDTSTDLYGKILSE